MKNVIDSASVVGLRRQGFYQIIDNKLKTKNIDFESHKLFKIIENMDNVSFLTKQEKLLKKINPSITTDIISKDNPSLLDTIIQKLQN